ncbi:MAG: endonuclease/exonuclease/phosphatase family protein, partial [Bacteroidaceae bacterium]|nr:endonuclease/exonuclease/phosphatase family protein [Bacteroidaceae bacterium]
MRKILTILIAALLACEVVAQAPIEIKMLSYNIRTLADDGDNSWKYRRHATRNMLNVHKPDLFGLQEAMGAHLKYIDRWIPRYDRVGVGRDDGKKRGEVMAIYYNKKRFDLLDSGTFWLSGTPAKVSRGWDAACYRTTTWVKLRDKESGKEFYFFNTHLDHKGRVAQAESVKLIVEKIKEIAGEEATVILGGDFNVAPEDEVLAPLGSFMQEARTTAAAADDKGTFNGWGRRKVKSVIDHVFYRGTAECHSYSILDGDYGAPYISDHYPVEVVF